MATTRRHLLDIPDLYALLDHVVLPGSGGESEGRSPGSPTRAPARLEVFDLWDTRTKADAEPTRSSTEYDLDRLQWRWEDGAGRMVTEGGTRRQGVIPTLASWSRLIDGELHEEGSEQHKAHPEYGLLACTSRCTEAPIRARLMATIGPCSEVTAQHWDEATVAGEVAFLLQHLDWAAEQRWFHELVDDAARIRRDLRQVLGERDPIALVCTIDTCRWPVEVMDAGSWFRCTGCGRTWSRMEAHRLYERQKPMSLAECAEALGRPVKTLHHWQAKRWIHSVGRDSRGRLYRLADVQAAALGIVNGQKVGA